MINSILKSASNLLHGILEDSPKYEIGEVVYSKNNVCVHPHNNLSTDVIHHPGYLNITCQYKDNTLNKNDITLHLTWTPNSSFLNLHDNKIRDRRSSDESYDSTISTCSGCIKQESLPTSSSQDLNTIDDLSFMSIDDAKVDKLSDSECSDNFATTPEYYAYQHNLTFPDSVPSSPAKKQTKKCRKFSVDLGDMRSLKLLFSDVDSKSGQLIIASRESQYKILHFHHGGLHKLSEILHEWNLFISSPKVKDDSLYVQFIVYRPPVSEFELHPEEGKTGKITADIWEKMLNDHGQVMDDLHLRKMVYFGGVDITLRSTIWPFLLQCFPYQSTYEERSWTKEVRKLEYQAIGKQRSRLTGSVKDKFKRNIECVIEKDVIRTDRSNPFYAGDGNPNLEIMKNILLNYAIYDIERGYTQGMSDLLAPILAAMVQEDEAFWCFIGVMRKGFFVCTPSDTDMEHNLQYLRELIRIMYPEFYKHLQRHADAMDLLFCHRWLLLCFKREFTEEAALCMWESCWSNYQTDYFHLFLCLAIITIYSDDIIKQDLRTDEMLFHFSSLAMHMDGFLVLRKARGLLYSFRLLEKVPCTLSKLCEQCGPGIWDSSHSPLVECAGIEHCKSFPCEYTVM